MRLLSKFNTITVWVSEKILVLFLAANCFIIFWSILYRYIFELGQQWTEEVAISLMVWSVFLGCNIVIRNNSHIRVEFIIAMLPEKYKRWVSAVTYIGMMFFLYLVFKYGLELVDILKLNRSPALRFRMFWVTSAIPVGFGLSILQLIELLMSDMKEIFSGIFGKGSEV